MESETPRSDGEAPAAPWTSDGKGEVAASDEPVPPPSWQSLKEKVRQLEELVKILPLDDLERRAAMQHLAQALHRLDHTRPYTIALVGVSGSGKSALINALFGRHLVVSKPSQATTGTIVKVRQILDGDSLAGDDPSLADYPQHVNHAKIFYHTHQSLTEVVETQCQAIPDLEIAYLADSAARDGGRLVDIEQMLERVRARRNQAHKGSSTTTLVLQGPQELVDLEDLLDVARQHKDLLKNPVEEVSLDKESDDGEGVSYVHSLMWERSKRNQNKDSATRVVPLIQKITMLISAPKHKPGLGRIILTDVPGVGASVTRHATQVLQQLRPLENDAVMLIISATEKLDTELGQRLLWLVTNVLLNRQDEQQRQRDAERIFLVITKSDVDEGTVDQIFQQALNDGIKQVADRISPTYYSDHQANIFRDTKAKTALVAQLLRARAEDGQEWLRGQEVALFDRTDVARDFYLERQRRALASSPDRDPAEAVLAWSNIPKLVERLKTFLGASRWARDLQAARSDFDAAAALVSARIYGQLQQISPRLLEADARAYLDGLEQDREAEYERMLQHRANAVLDGFDRAVEAMDTPGEEDSRALLKAQLDQIVADMLSRIKAYVHTPEFEQAMTNPSRNLYTRRNRRYRGSLKAIEELQKQVFTWSYHAAPQVAAAMMQRLRENLNNQQVRASLRLLCDELRDDEGLLKRFDAIIKQTQSQYEQACRSAMLYRIMSIDIEEGLLSAVQNFGQVEASPKAEEAARPAAAAEQRPNAGAQSAMLREELLNVYNDVYRNLALYLTNGLVPLFFYQLYHEEGTKSQLQLLIQDLNAKLLKPTERKHGQEPGLLYRQFTQANFAKFQDATQWLDYQDRLQQIVT